MHPGQRAAQQQLAHQQIVTAAGVLAERFGLEPLELPVGNPRDPQTAMLRQQQAVVTLLEGLVEKTAPAAESRDSLDELDLPANTADALRAAGLDSAEAIQAKSDDELAEVQGLGPASVRRLRKALEDRGY
jgi:DNA uptake protein ComE-like DNA-binding protein